MKRLLFSAIMCTALVVHAQQEIRIYKDVAPGSENWKHKEVKTTMIGAGGKSTLYLNVVTPTLALYRPEPGRANGTAIVVCPGGAYMGLAWELEGTNTAKWLAARGITAFVLKYRTMPLPEDSIERGKVIDSFFSRIGRAKDFKKGTLQLDEHRKRAIADGQQAVRYIREHASEWQIKTDKIGIMGFSAGAGVTIGVIRQHDSLSKPNFAASIYGFDSDQEQPLNTDAPPLFIVATQGDQMVAVQQSIKIFTEWNDLKIPVELHLFEKGPHGFGISKLNLPVDEWTMSFERWLQSRGLASTSKP